MRLRTGARADGALGGAVLRSERRGRGSSVHEVREDRLQRLRPRLRKELPKRPGGAPEVALE